MSGSAVIDRFLAGVTDPAQADPSVFAPDAVLDATVPNWRFELRGGRQVAAQLAHWFADPAEFEQLRREPLPDGELVQFFLRWTEHGVPHACHQAHLITTRDGQIVADTMFCGGRWPAPLLAEMAAEHVH